MPKNNWVLGTFYRVLHISSGANTLLVTLTIGVMLHFRDFRAVWLIVLLACVIKLFLQPLFAFGQSTLFGFPPVWHQIVVLEASMPTAALSAVFAKRYGCDAELTSILVFTTFISSILTIVSMIWLLG
ncbi:MAG: AEC family transporter [Kiritimatiellae bacterium]|nr:AEC family transporter [Kiritimatiellia bacterium]